MHENSQQAVESKTKDTALKPLHEKITEAISKDDDLLGRILKALTNPLVLLVAIPALIYLWKHQQKSADPKTNPEKAAKLRKKNKQLKKQLRGHSHIKNGRRKATALIN